MRPCTHCHRKECNCDQVACGLTPKPGDIFRATVRGRPDQVIMKCDLSGSLAWFSPRQIAGQRWITDAQVTDLVPLRLVDESKAVVIPESEFYDFANQVSYMDGKFVEGQLRRMLKPVEPPIPPEPEGDVVLMGERGILVHRMQDGWTIGGGIKRPWHYVYQVYGPFAVYRKED